MSLVSNKLAVVVFVCTFGAASALMAQGSPTDGERAEEAAAPRQLYQVWTAGPSQMLTTLAATDAALLAGTDTGEIERSEDRGQTFSSEPFGRPVWMPPFAPAPRSALNIVLGTSVVIPGRTAAADLIRRPPPTRTRSPYSAPKAASEALYQINGFGRVGTGLWMSYSEDRLFFYHTPAALFNFDNETGAAFLEEGGTNMDSPAFWSTPWVRGLPRADWWGFEWTPQIEYDADVRQARHLSRALLFNPDVPHGKTTLIATDSGTFFATSDQGVYASTDDGRTFVHVYAPTSGGCRDGVVVRNQDGSETLLVLGRESVLASPTTSVAFVPRASAGEDAELVVAADASAAWLRHRDPTSGEMTFVRIAGSPIEDALVSTTDGLHFVQDGLLIPFARANVDQVVTSESGETWATKGRTLLEGDADPTTWRVIAQLPAKAKALAVHQGTLFVATSTAIFAVAPASGGPRALTRADIERAMAARAADPPMDMVLAAASRRMVPRLDSRIHLAGLFPQFQLSFVAIGAVNRADLNAGFLTYAVNGGRAAAGDIDRAVGDSDDATFIKTRDYIDLAVSSFAIWDLPEIFAHNSRPRRVREAKKAFDKVEHEIVTLYRSRRDLRDRLVAMPPKGRAAREALALDVDELTARLDALSGGLFRGSKRYAREDRQGEEARAVAERASEHYFVDDSALESRKFRAAIKGLLPSTELYARVTYSRLFEPTFNFELLDGESPWIDRAAEGAILDSRLSMMWDLPRLVFNAEELDVYRLAHVQRLVTEEALQTYFALRKQEAKVDPADELGRVLDALHREQLTKTLEAFLEAPEDRD